LNPLEQRAIQFVQLYSLMKGLKKVRRKGRETAYNKEIKHLYDRMVFKELTELESRRALESLIFLVEKRDRTVYSRTCANQGTQREYTEQDKAASP
jgi:hypothetical protein